MKRPAFLFLLVSLCALAACAGRSDNFPFPRLAPSAPPQNMIEEIPENPSPSQQIWHPGYWAYDGRSFNWVDGTFMVRPSPTAVWSPDRWDRHDYGWAFIPGYWQ